MCKNLNCKFSFSEPGKRAMRYKRDMCLICDKPRLSEALEKPHSRGRVLRIFKRFKEFPMEYAALQSEVASVSESACNNLVERAGAEPVRVRRKPAAAIDATSWGDCLARRKSAREPAATETEYRELVRADRLAVKRKFWPELNTRRVRKRPAGNGEPPRADDGHSPAAAFDIAFNDAGLPAPTHSPEAAMVEKWCKFGSWAMCEDCGGLNPRPLHPMDATRVSKPIITAKACKHCREGKRVPKPEDIPEPLRDLPGEVIEALRPLSIDCGPYKRAPNGYRVHSSMTRVSWKESDVQEAIKALPKRGLRTAARRAFKHLMQNEDSSYASFVERHRDFLADYPEADDAQRRRPLQFIEERGLECALWPHLYWATALCETEERATDCRRVARLREDECSWFDGADDDGDDETDPERHSAKRSFMRKVLSPVIGYSTDYELLHFVYDLVLWSR